MGLYATHGTEVAIGALDTRLRARGVVCAYPRVARDELEFVAATPEQLAPGYRGVAEPISELAALPAGALDAIIVPGLAFTAGGRRLGQGGGFYDRLLAREPAWALGVCFEVQLEAELPVEPHDAVVDGVFTELGVKREPSRN